jgi:hypothetical protein
MSQFAPTTSCITSLYPLSGNLWVGRTTDGHPQSFKSLPAYREYLAKLALSGKICPDVSVPIIPKREKVQATPFAQFMEFKPANPTVQAQYSAMSPYWQGVDETISALSKGQFSRGI